ncbi:hypothetical protein [Pseudogulbenkiania subflava]|uniref:hypothetical protein n=1 Tax=Pseudogulbenkiania subflava TaxID=451637 RepID=UPI00117A36FA|nr:hypothetical protein [Pseudogulbenkiania subflava]
MDCIIVRPFILSVLLCCSVRPATPGAADVTKALGKWRIGEPISIAARLVSPRCYGIFTPPEEKLAEGCFGQLLT